MRCRRTPRGALLHCTKQLTHCLSESLRCGAYYHSCCVALRVCSHCTTQHNSDAHVLAKPGVKGLPKCCALWPAVCIPRPASGERACADGDAAGIESSADGLGAVKLRPDVPTLGMAELCVEAPTADKLGANASRAAVHAQPDVASGCCAVVHASGERADALQSVVCTTKHEQSTRVPAV